MSKPFRPPFPGFGTSVPKALPQYGLGGIIKKAAKATKKGVTASMAGVAALPKKTGKAIAKGAKSLKPPMADGYIFPNKAAKDAYVAEKARRAKLPKDEQEYLSRRDAGESSGYQGTDNHTVPDTFAKWQQTDEYKKKYGETAGFHPKFERTTKTNKDKH